MDARMKRRSSIFRQDFVPQEESLSTTSDTTESSEPCKTEQSEEPIQQYIKDLKVEQKHWLAESDLVKLNYKNLIEENKCRVMKVSKSDLYSMLSHSEKAEYDILFNREDYAPLLSAIEDLKKKVAIVSVQYETSQNLYQNQMDTQLRQSSNQAQFENLMNQIAARCNESDGEDFSDGDSISDFLSDSESERGMDID